MNLSNKVLVKGNQGLIMQSIYPNASKSNAKAVTVCPLKFEIVLSIQEFMLYYQAWEEIVLKNIFVEDHYGTV